MVFTQSAIDIDECWYQEQVCRYPCYRVTITYTQEMEQWYYPQANATSGNHLHHSRKHREIAVAHSLYGIAQDSEQPQHGIEVVGYAHKHGGILHDSR